MDDSDTTPENSNSIPLLLGTDSIGAPVFVLEVIFQLTVRPKKLLTNKLVSLC